MWSIEAKRALIDVSAQGLSISRQCSLLGLSRSTFLYEVKGESPENLLFMRLLDEQYTATPFYGVLRMTAQLRVLGYEVNEKRIRRLLRLMALEAIYPKPNLSAPILGHRVFPYLLRKVTIARVNQAVEHRVHPARLPLEYGHHLHPYEGRICVLNGSDRLV